jgi:hypothetical protein
MFHRYSRIDLPLNCRNTVSEESRSVAVMNIKEGFRFDFHYRYTATSHLLCVHLIGSSGRLSASDWSSGSPI